MGNSNKKRSKKTPKIENLSQSVLSILKKDSNKTFNHKQISAALGVNDTSSRNLIVKRLKKLAAAGTIEEVERGKFKLVKSQDYYIGILDVTSKGTGYVIVDELEDDILIPKKNLNHAFNRDEVEVYVYKNRKGSRAEGEITNIIKRNKTEFVGTIEVHENFAFVKIQDGSMYTDFFVPGRNINDAKDGQIVLVSMEEWGEKDESPQGKIIQVLGDPGEQDTEMHAILAQYGLPYEFPAAVERDAEKLDTTITQKDIDSRRDMRDILTFTILELFK